jgi:hypothetical protein
MRIAIKKHNQRYLEQIANQMECDRATALDYLLFELRKNNYSFGSPLPNSEEKPAMPEPLHGINFKSPRAIREFEELQQEVDPIIERLVLAGLESF